jgi:hypothetical protein
MAESSAPVPAPQTAENLLFSAGQRDHRPNSKPMIRKALAAILGALLLQVTFGAAFAQISASDVWRLDRGCEVAGGTRMSAPAEALRRAAPNTAMAAASAATIADQPSAAMPIPVPAAPQGGAACPHDMVLIEGEYCSEVLQSCARWLDDESLPFARCDEYHRPSRCLGPRYKLRFCIDRYEYTAPGEELPLNYQSFQSSRTLCESLGKRLCTESEWNFACEGEEMRPYPYGFNREAKCNQDRDDLYEPNPHRQILADRRERSDARPECVSPFGVYNLAGNLDESVLREGREHVEPFRNALKGGWWMPARNRCRPATTAHDDYYKDIQVGTRCCAAANTG